MEERSQQVLVAASLPNHRERTIKLPFHPCGRVDLAWTATVEAASCGEHLTVGDVQKAIGTESLGRSVCRDVRDGDHPCYASACKGQRVRTCDDALRNIDLYHGGHGTKLLFEELSPERLGDREVVYVVKFSCA